jgi:hypothetical protein
MTLVMQLWEECPHARPPAVVSRHVGVTGDRDRHRRRQREAVWIAVLLEPILEPSIFPGRGAMRYAVGC